MTKRTLKEMKELAKSRKGKCLSKKYINNSTKLKWQCNEGHVWWATPAHVNYSTWCPHCANNIKLSIRHMQVLAKKKGGRCLSKSYNNNRTKLKWQCKKGHVWEATPGHVMLGTWCPTCADLNAGSTQRSSIKAMRSLAKEKMGKCLSKNYVNTLTKLKWQCKHKHIWEATPHDINSGRWCPECTLWTRERTCRKYFEILFNQNFPKTKPSWLLNDKGNLMELDGYCKKLNLAFEHHGEQHYKPHKFFSQLRDFNEQKRDDSIKRKLCKENNVKLIEIPYSLKHKGLKGFIIKQCKLKGIIPPRAGKKIAPWEVYSSQLDDMQRLAKSRNGRCLSKEYVNNKTKLKWQCNKGHIWEATPDCIKRGHWCHTCGGSTKSSIEEMRRLAKKKNGKCLSKVYVNNRTKLKWQCQKKHIWKTTPKDVKRGHWCPICARKREK